MAGYDAQSSLILGVRPETGNRAEGLTTFSDDKLARIEALDCADHSQIVIVHQFVVETREKCQHWPVVGENEPGKPFHSGTRSVLGQNLEQLNAESLALPGIIDDNGKFSVVRFASHILRERDDARIRATDRLANQGEPVRRMHIRHAVELIGRELAQRRKESIPARRLRQPAHELLHSRSIIAACNAQRDCTAVFQFQEPNGPLRHGTIGLRLAENVSHGIGPFYAHDALSEAKLSFSPSVQRKRRYLEME